MSKTGDLSPPQERLSAEAQVRLSREYMLFSRSVQGATDPIAIDRADGIYFWDRSGKRYIDFFSHLVNVIIGHGDHR